MTYYIMKDDEGYLVEELFKTPEEAREYARILFLQSSFKTVLCFQIYHIDTRKGTMRLCERFHDDSIEGEDEF